MTELTPEPRVRWSDRERPFLEKAVLAYKEYITARNSGRFSDGSGNIDTEKLASSPEGVANTLAVIAYSEKAQISYGQALEEIISAANS